MFTENSSFITLYVKSLELTINFYKLLRLKPIEQDTNKVVFRIGDYELHFVSFNSLSEEDYEYNSEGSFGIGALLYIGSRNIEKTHSLIIKANPLKVTQIKPNDWESKEFLFEDPNGYKFVVFEDLEF